MKILNKKIFQNELEWLEELKKASGYVNESIISFCDHKRLSDAPPVTPSLIESLVNFLTKKFADFSIEVEPEDIEDIKRYFSDVNKPNYYSIKEYIITQITKVKEGKYE